MQCTVNDVIASLKAFVPTGDESQDVGTLYDILDGFEEMQGRSRAVRTMFGVLERFPSADLGAPGPIVHELEAIPGFEGSLRASVRRRPTPSTVWMVNRVLNSELTPIQRRTWLTILRSVIRHPAATVSLKQQAKAFLAHQERCNTTRARAV